MPCFGLICLRQKSFTPDRRPWKILETASRRIGIRMEADKSLLESAFAVPFFLSDLPLPFGVGQ